MKTGEVMRFRCEDCQIVFDLCVDHQRQVEVTQQAPLTDFGEPRCCPFCGAGELTSLHETAIRVAPGR